MKKFFVPSAFDNNVEKFEFKSGKTNINGTTPSINNITNKPIKTTKAKKNKKKLKTKKEETIQGKSRGPLAPSKLAALAAETPTPKVKSGRIEKKNNKKQKNQKLDMTPALQNAAKELIENKAKETNTPTHKLKATKKQKIATSATLTSLENKFKTQLMGGRFRFLNELLYTMDSSAAQSLFREDNEAFGAYHAGYRQQVEKWPVNPLNRIIKMVRRLPRVLEIGDFGCGEGKLAQSVPHKVQSMDLVSSRDDIIACDMANTPLQAESLDVAVYCLSLMGTNMNDYLLEANRVLKIGGFVFIAEIQSRFDDVRQFVRSLESCGFELIKKDENVKLFYFFQFKKVRNVGRVARLEPFSLKPCLYRKR